MKMTEQDKVKTVLAFYQVSNQLKNIMIDPNNQLSIADHMFGSMILSLITESELDTKRDLAKEIRMIYFQQFLKLPNALHLLDQIDHRQLALELNELYYSSSAEAKMAHYYQMLDSVLTKMIAEKGIESTDCLYYEALKQELFIPKNGTEYQKYYHILEFYLLNHRLREQVRSGWTPSKWNVKKDRLEHISEHVVSTVGLACVMNYVFDAFHDSSFDEALKTLVLHETEECLIGDITPFSGVSEEKKMKMGHQAVETCFQNLEKKEEYVRKLINFDFKDTPAYYCDKLDADLQAKVYEESRVMPTFEENQHSTVLQDPRIKDIIRQGAKTPFDVWYWFDQDKYVDTPAFMHVLDGAKKYQLKDLVKNIDQTISPTSGFTKKIVFKNYQSE